MRKHIIRALAIILALAPLTLSVACDGGDDSANVTPPAQQETPIEETPGEENPSEGNPAEDAPSEENPSEGEPAEDAPSDDNPSDDEPVEDEKPSLPGGLVDGGNFESGH
ncbi:MAG: hypothetical protein ACI4MH_01255 [Candidatus Coproplasma sp.]